MAADAFELSDDDPPPIVPTARKAPVLRQYQTDVIEAARREVAAGNRRIVLVAPTGAGKTVIAGQIVRNAVDAGKRVMFLAHRQELIVQCSRKLHDVGIDHGIIKAGFPTRPDQPVQVAGVQTLHARAVRSAVVDMPSCDLVIIDEAHHIRARTYEDILRHYPDAVLIGLTATPCRGDGRGLGAAFDTIVECPPISEMVENGFLVPTRVYAPTRPDLSGVKVARGDYVEGQLQAAMDQPKLTGDIVSHWLRLAEGRKTIVFASGVNHSLHLRDQFRAAGIVAEHIDGTTPAEERAGIIQRLAAGYVDLVVNAMVLTEGFDEPSIACIVLARPTKSMGLYRQMVGRVLRPAPGKVDALILDHAGAVFEHGFIDEKIEWTLKEDKKAVSVKQAARSQGKVPTLTTCPECAAVRYAGRPCGACGWHAIPRAEAIEVAEGELRETNRQRQIAADATTQGRQDFHAELLWIANERGYQRGWVSYKYRAKFGTWPGQLTPVPRRPSEATRAWVRAQTDLWKAQQKRQARQQAAQPEEKTA